MSRVAGGQGSGKRRTKAAPVVVVMGSDSDLPVVEPAFEMLRELGIPYRARVMSCHRTPEAVAEFARGAEGAGIRVIIAAAGAAASLAGVIAAFTTLPVIGVPVDSSPLQGVDALYATVMMPPGVPVATMAVGRAGAKNAALFAGEILALGDPGMARAVKAYRRKLVRQVDEKNAALQRRLGAWSD